MLLTDHPRLSSAALPRLDGKEVLVGPDPSICKVKGVMFGGRKQFLQNLIGEKAFEDLVSTLSPQTAQNARTPLASSWCDFASLVEFDRAAFERLHKQYPNVLALIGAASAELGIGRVYKMLDNAELVTFFENTARFHNQYQKFGSVEFVRTPKGGLMVFSDYPCYSPIYCASAVGYYLEAILRHGGRDPEVVETTCKTRGDASCTFQMTWQ
jgi:predicted hydrocarbon binding protein